MEPTNWKCTKDREMERVLHCNSQAIFKILLSSILLTWITSVSSSTCPNSELGSTTITTMKASFSGFDSQTYGTLMGPVSNSIYYLCRLSNINNQDKAVIARVYQNSTLNWMAAFSFWPIIKSLATDPNEQSIYVASYTDHLSVIKMNSSDGSIKYQQQFSSINGKNHDIKINVLHDNSGYFILGKALTLITIICKCLISSCTCQSTLYLFSDAFAQLKINENQFFFLATGLLSAVHFCKVTFGNTAIDWSNIMTCSTSSCDVSNSESLLNNDSSEIYCIFIYGNPKYLYMTTFNSSSGSVLGSRYKSSESCSLVYGSAQIDNYLVATLTCSSGAGLLILDTINYQFTFKSFVGAFMISAAIDSGTSGRVIIGGDMTNSCYITKFTIPSINTHPDFTASSLSMTALGPNNEAITSEASLALYTYSLISPTSDLQYTNQTVSYSSTSEIYFQTKTQIFSVTESNNSTIIPDLPCSSSGNISIVYSLSNYNGTNVPSFVLINCVTEVLSIVAPSASTSTEYDFYISSSIPGVSNPVQKIIQLTIKKCTASNCQKCSASNSSVCSTCDSGYDLNSGICSLTETKTAKSISSANQSIVGATVGVAIIISLLNISSLSSLWSMINQAQIFFLLLLTGAFIPKDIQTIITGLKICLNPFYYFSSGSGTSSNFVTNYFDFGLEDSKLEPLSIKSDSTAVNIYSFVSSIIALIFIHLCIVLLECLCKACLNREKCELTTKASEWIFEKLMILISFAFYIRLTMKLNQLILISSVSEIYHFNTSDSKCIISLVIAIIVLVLCILLICAIAYLACFQQEYENKRNKFAQFFNGVTKEKKFKIYIVFLFIRRFIFVVILITLVPKSSVITIYVLIILQIAYMCILIIKRPYAEVKSNIIEIINEVYFITMLISLLFYNSIDRWLGTPTTAYVWVMSSNNMISFTIVLIDAIKKVYIKIKSCCCSNNAIEPKPNENRMQNEAEEVDISNQQISRIGMNQENKTSQNEVQTPKPPVPDQNVYMRRIYRIR